MNWINGVYFNPFFGIESFNCISTNTLTLFKEKKIVLRVLVYGEP